jgi:hypothetical protein
MRKSVTSVQTFSSFSLVSEFPSIWEPCRIMIISAK